MIPSKQATKCIKWVNNQLDNMDVNLVMEESLPIKLKRRHKRNDSELSIDAITSNVDPAKKYHIEMTNRIVDTIVSNIE